MLVRAKLQFEGFDNATQPQKPHWESVRPVFAFPYEYKIHGQISENEITFLDTVVFKGERFIKESILATFSSHLVTLGLNTVTPVLVNFVCIWYKIQ